MARQEQEQTTTILPVRYYNQTAPFWDFIADLEERSMKNNQRNNEVEGDSSDNEANEQQRPNPWAEGWAGFPWGPFPHRGRHSYHHGPPPPPNCEGPPAPPASKGEEGEAGPSDPRGPPPPFSESPEQGRRHHSRYGPGSHHGPGARRGHCGARGGRGGFGGFGRGRGHYFHPYATGMGGPFGHLADLFQQQLFGGEETNENKETEDFHPDIDVFDTPSSFIVHISLPGAKKEDVGVNWDAEKSELSIAGVVYRPGDEELLKMLALDERKVGAFERKVRLGSRANPAQVDVEGIVAKLEDGVLSVEVPKMEGGFVEVRKVNIE